MMAKKFFSKALSVGLSLALCAGMVAPAFAHVVAIDGGDSHEVETVQKGVDMIAGSDSKSGTITLTEDANENVIVSKGDVTIDLGGNDLTGKGNTSVITVKGEGTKLTVEDKSEDGDGKITGGNATFGGGVNVTDGAEFVLEGGNITDNTAKANGGGVYVDNGKVTMNGGTISGNNGGNVGGGVYVNTQAAEKNGKEAVFEMNGGEISNNTATSGGGVGAYTGSSGGKDYFNTGEDSYVAIDINGGSITNNTATTGDGGGVAAQHNTVEIDNAVISGNTAGNIGGGVWLANSNTTIKNSTITGNHVLDVTGKAPNGGGGVYVGGGTADISKTEISKNTSKTNGGGISGDGKMTLTDVPIIDNFAEVRGGGVYLLKNGSFIMLGEDSKLYNNKAGTSSDDLYKKQNSTVKLPSAMLMNVTGKDGKPITGWFFDGTDRWGNGKNAYTSQDHAVNGATSGSYFTGTLSLKAAHDQYFDVVYSDGVDGSLFDNQKYEVENKQPIPLFNGEVPTRPGYTFAGWLVDGDSFDPTDGTVTGVLNLVANWIEIPNTEIPDTDVPLGGGDDETELDENTVPLASGPVTRAEFIDYLWRHEGEPASNGACTFADVPEDHPYALALAWGEQNGIAEAYEDGTFEPDELVTVADVREFLGNFAGVFGGNAVSAAGLTTLTGDDDEAVLNCDEVLAEFFGEEYTPAQNKDEELDTAA